MKISIFLLFISTCQLTFAQSKLDKKAAEIEAEGRLLYRSEMASWYGSDLFIATEPDRNSIGGYFSYAQGDSTTCVFFSNAKRPKITGTMTFDQSFELDKASVNLQVREFSEVERDLFELRSAALAEIQSDTLFKTYTGTNLNLIPLISKGEKKVYVLTGPTESGVVIFGNDYLLSYNKKNKLTDKKALHANIIAISYKAEEGQIGAPVGSMHSHTEETGEFMTPTDVCTLMLYCKYTSWEQHTVVSENYVSIWNCAANRLAILHRNAMENMFDDQKSKE